MCGSGGVCPQYVLLDMYYSSIGVHYMAMSDIATVAMTGLMHLIGMSRYF